MTIELVQHIIVEESTSIKWVKIIVFVLTRPAQVQDANAKGNKRTAFPTLPYQQAKTGTVLELQIRKGIEDNSMISFLISHENIYSPTCIKHLRDNQNVFA